MVVDSNGYCVRVAVMVLERGVTIMVLESDVYRVRE
jgi:hypothetical protein